MIDLVVEPLTPARLADYLRFFDERAFTDNPRWASCYCYFPLHDPERTDWQQRTGDENRAAVSGCAAAGRAPGLLAYHAGEVVGWCSAGPGTAYPMLKDEPGTHDASVGFVMCFVIDPALRRKGIAKALLAGACDALRAQGIQRVRARPSKRAQTPAALHLGPLPLYLDAGFHVVREDDDGDVIVEKQLS